MITRSKLKSFNNSNHKSKIMEDKQININIQYYSGDESPEWFLSQIDSLKAINKWSNDIALIHLKSKLTGNAKLYFQNDPDLNKLTYDLAKQKLLKFFSADNNPSANLVLLNNMYLIPGETIRNFGQRVNTLVSKTYNSVNDVNALNQIKSLHFINALPTDLKEKLLLENTSKFDDLIQRAHDITSVQQALKQAELHSTIVQASNNNNREIQELNKQIESLTEKVQLLQIKCQFCGSNEHIMSECNNFKTSVTPKAENVNYMARSNNNRQNFSRQNQNLSRQNRITCFFCNRPGHVIRDCRQLQNLQNSAPRFPVQNARRPHNSHFRPNNNFQRGAQQAPHCNLQHFPMQESNPFHSETVPKHLN